MATLSTPGVAMILQVLITMIAGWINRHQQQVIAYLLEENRTSCIETWSTQR
jgi:hypothetical protein